MKSIRVTVAAAALLGGLAAFGANAQAPDFAAASRLVHTDASSFDQEAAAVAAFPGGGYVVAWTDDRNELNGDIYARIYDADLNPVTEVAVAIGPGRQESSPDIAVLSNGRFVVVWDDDAIDPDGWGAAARVFEADGTPVATRIEVNTATDGDNSAARVAALPNDRFVVVWHSEDVTDYDIRYRVFDGGANTTNDITNVMVSEQAASAPNSDEELWPAVDALEGGGFVIAWESPSGGNSDIIARRFDAAYAANGGAFTVNTSTAGVQGRPDVLGLADGSFVVAWTDQQLGGGDASSSAVRAQRFLANGSAAGDETLLNTSTTNSQLDVSLSRMEETGFLAAWTDYSRTAPDTSDAAVRAQHFFNDLSRLGDEFVVNDVTASDQRRPDAALLSNGQVIVAFDDRSDFATEGVNVRTRRFTPPTPPLFALGDASDFTGQVLASEATAAPNGDVIVEFGFDDAFSTMGGGGEVELTATLTNASFTRPVSTGEFTQPADTECAFQIASGGGAGGDTVGFVSTGQVNACSGPGANSGSLSLPVEVDTVGEPVSVEIRLTPTVDAGGYSGDSESFDLLGFERLLSYAVDFNDAAAPPVGRFDADGDALEGSGEIARIAVSVNGDVDEATLGGGAASADSADDVVDTAGVIVTFPEGAAGVGGVAVSGAAACTPGSGADANVYTCPASGAQLDAFDGATNGLVTLTADADPQTAITPQTPTVALDVTGDSGFAAADFDAVDVAPLSINDGLLETAVTAAANAFDWVRIGPDGTQSNFRFALAHAADASAVTQVRVTCGVDNRGDFGVITLDPSPDNADAAVGFRTSGSVLSFTSAALGEAAGATGNCDIASVELQYPDGVLSTGDVGGARADRLLLQRRGIGLTDL